MSISVITAVRNGAATIVSCLDSVRRQTTSAEHIVVDGQSTDGTLQILQSRSDPQLKFVSEADRGIYDAMSKGLRMAKGEIVGFLNSDDFYASPRVLEHVSRFMNDPGMASCYGDLQYVQTPVHEDSQPALCENNSRFEISGEVLVRSWRAGTMTPESFYWGWMPPHPTFFVRRAVYEKLGGFRLDLGTAADYELMLRFLVKHAISTTYVPHVLVKMRAGGVSNATLANRLRANRNDRLAWKVNGLRPYPWTLLLKPVRKLGQWKIERDQRRVPHTP